MLYNSRLTTHLSRPRLLKIRYIIIQGSFKHFRNTIAGYCCSGYCINTMQIIRS